MAPCDGSCSLPLGHNGGHQECLSCIEQDVDRLETLVENKDKDIVTVCEYSQAQNDALMMMNTDSLNIALRKQNLVQRGNKEEKVKRLVEYALKLQDRKNRRIVEPMVELETNVNFLGGTSSILPRVQANMDAEKRERIIREKRAAANEQRRQQEEAEEERRLDREAAEEREQEQLFRAQMWPNPWQEQQQRNPGNDLRPREAPWLQQER